MQKRLFNRALGAATLAVAGLMALAPAAHAQVQERNIKLGIQNPKGHPIELGTVRFAELLAQRSGGKLKVQVFPGGQLGSDVQTLTALQSGTVEMSIMNSGILASQVRDFAVFDFPFMFANPREADAVVDGPVGQKLHARLGERNLVGVAYWELGFRNLTNSRKPINTVEDIAGLKLRVIPNPINVDWVRALGANPTPLAFTELFAAMEQRAVDGQENPLSVILANKFAEVQKHLALTNHQYNPQSFLVSKRLWDSLSAEERGLITAAAVEAGQYQRQVNRELAAGQLAALRQAGMQVTELPPAEVAKLRERMQPVIAKHSEGIAATVHELQAELARLRR